MPFPNAEWLEMSYIDYENSKLEFNSLKKRVHWKKYNKEQIQNAFFSLHVSLKISKCIISSIDNQPFDIFVDGKLFGPFYKIIVQPLISNNKPLILPIMTFLPIQL